ncbi:MAG: rod-binding protein [Bryobacteraceae bacterium]|nr:rod-binding protein [Bryobacteraceae bacterium]
MNVSQASRNAGVVTAPEEPSPEKILEAAGQFEAMLIEQMLKTMRESSEGGWMGSGGDAGATMTEYAEQEFARVMAAGGGFGIAKMLADGLGGGPR